MYRGASLTTTDARPPFMRENVMPDKLHMKPIKYLPAYFAHHELKPLRCQARTRIACNNQDRL